MGGKENTCIATEVIVRTVIQQSNWFYLSQHFCNMQYFHNTQVQLFIQLIITTEVLMNASPLILSHTVGKHQVSTAICHSLSPPHQVSLSHTHFQALLLPLLPFLQMNKAGNRKAMQLPKTICYGNNKGRNRNRYPNSSWRGDFPEELNSGPFYNSFTSLSVYHPVNTLLVHPAERLLSALPSADRAQPNYNQATHRIFFFIATLSLKCFNHFLSLFVMATAVEAFLSWPSH